MSLFFKATNLNIVSQNIINDCSGLLLELDEEFYDTSVSIDEYLKHIVGTVRKPVKILYLTRQFDASGNLICGGLNSLLYEKNMEIFKKASSLAQALATENKQEVMVVIGNDLAGFDVSCSAKLVNIFMQCYTEFPNVIYGIENECLPNSESIGYEYFLPKLHNDLVKGLRFFGNKIKIYSVLNIYNALDVINHYPVYGINISDYFRDMKETIGLIHFTNCNGRSKVKSGDLDPLLSAYSGMGFSCPLVLDMPFIEYSDRFKSLLSNGV